MNATIAEIKGGTRKKYVILTQIEPLFTAIKWGENAYTMPKDIDSDLDTIKSLGKGSIMLDVFALRKW